MMDELSLENATATWRARGQELSQSFKRQQWEIGDWLVNGAALLHPELAAIEPQQLLYPDNRLKTEVYDFAQRLFPDYTRETLRQFAFAARAFPSLTRVHANLSFGHYRAALSAEESTRSEWLAMADKGSWPVSTLRLAIAEVAYRAAHEELGQPVPTPEQNTPLLPHPKKAMSKIFSRSTLPIKSQIKFDALARFHGVEPEILLVRIVNAYLEDHVGDIDAAEQAQEENMARCGIDEQAFEKDRGMPREQWLAQQAIAERERAERIKEEQKERHRKQQVEAVEKARQAREAAEAIKKAEWASEEPYIQLRGLITRIDNTLKQIGDAACVEPAAPEPAKEEEVAA